MGKNFRPQEIEQKVKAIVQEMFHVKPEVLTPEMEFARCQMSENGGAPGDLPPEIPWVIEEDMAELGMRLEEAFDITIPVRDLNKVRTLGDLIELVKRRLGPSGGS